MLGLLATRATTSGSTPWTGGLMFSLSACSRCCCCWYTCARCAAHACANLASWSLTPSCALRRAFSRASTACSRARTADSRERTSFSRAATCWSRSRSSRDLCGSSVSCRHGGRPHSGLTLSAARGRGLAAGQSRAPGSAPCWAGASAVRNVPRQSRLVSRTQARTFCRSMALTTAPRWFE